MEKRNPLALWWENTMENSMEIPLKTRNKTIPLLGIYPEKIITEKDACTPVFTAALFTIARTWKQPRCPSTNEWIKKSESETKSCSVLSLYNSMDCTVHGIFQARILEWVAFPFSRGSSQLRGRTQVSSLAGRFFTT